ncbi:hypothetical protein GmRootV59_22930 [Variovorax sp. V59]|uniref:DNA-primase RepB domain-containing protein n=1 Tax=unclassified Variovorax TaxID=663243 RepID=UPI0034E857CC
MEALVNFFTRGVTWQGARLTPTAAALLMELADRTQNRDGAPVIAGRRFLAARLRGKPCAESTLSAALAQLTALRVIRRERRRPELGARPCIGVQVHEDVALTWVNPALIEMAMAWQARRAALRAAGKRGAGAYPPPMPITLPLPEPFGTHPGTANMQNQNTPKTQPPHGKPSIHAGSEGASSRKSVTPVAGNRWDCINTPPCPWTEGGGPDPTGTGQPPGAVFPGTPVGCAEPAPAGGGACSVPGEPSIEADKVVHAAGTFIYPDGGVDNFSVPPGTSFRLSTPMPQAAGVGSLEGPVPRGLRFPGVAPAVGEQRPWDAAADARRFAHWIWKVSHRDCLLKLAALRIDVTGAPSGGQFELFNNLVLDPSPRGGLMLLNFAKLKNQVIARSMAHFRKREKDSEYPWIGESLFAGPLDGSHVILVDDVKTPAPIPEFEGHMFAALETSENNYQHFYAADRPLSNSERHQIQKIITTQAGGDPGATSGLQLHRFPGSINLKNGKYRFETRLAAIPVCEGKRIRVDELLLRSAGVALSPAAKALLAGKLPAAQRAHRAGRRDETPSGRAFSETMRRLQRGEPEGDILADLAAEVAARGKQDPAAWASLTVSKAAWALAHGGDLSSFPRGSRP